MAKIRCKCGYIIVDQTDKLPYKGYILPDTEIDKISTALINTIDSLDEANKLGKRLEWIKNNFHLPPYPTDLKDSSMIYDKITSELVDKTQDIFECNNCGRILIQIGQTNEFKTFCPDTNDTKGILKGKE